MPLVTNRVTSNLCPNQWTIYICLYVSKMERYALFILNKHESSYSDTGRLQNRNYIL